MRFKLATYGILLIIPLTYTNNTFAETNLPIDLIELLGEMSDDDLLEVTLSELKQMPNKSQSKQIEQQYPKQNSDVLTPAGGDLK